MNLVRSTCMCVRWTLLVTGKSHCFTSLFSSSFRVISRQPVPPHHPTTQPHSTFHSTHPHPVFPHRNSDNVQRSQLGSGMSKKQQAKAFISRLNQIAEETYNALFSKQQLQELVQEMNLQVGSFEGFLSSLNNQGYLLKKGPRSYQLRTADY